MTTLLILGSKPDPAIPPASAFSHLACANASGYSAERHGLPVPTYTVMSAILTSGKDASNDLALRALPGLRTGTLYFYPFAASGRQPLRRVLNRLKSVRTHPYYFRSKLRSLGYGYENFVSRPWEFYRTLIKEACDGDRMVLASVDAKRPSTGMIALVLGISGERYTRYILSGFSFEITHAYTDNPLIRERGTTHSKHADTDIAVLSCLSRKYGNIFTTEPTISERTGVPMLSGTGDEQLPRGAEMT